MSLLTCSLSPLSVIVPGGHTRYIWGHAVSRYAETIHRHGTRIPARLRDHVSAQFCQRQTVFPGDTRAEGRFSGAYAQSVCEQIRDMVQLMVAHKCLSRGAVIGPVIGPWDQLLGTVQEEF